MAPYRWLLFSCWLASAEAQDSLCPCVESSSPLLSTLSDVSGSGDGFDCVDFTPEPGLFVPTHCYPAAYGSSCAPWDSALPPSCNTTHAPSWCALSWCYVDKNACKATTHDIQRSVYFPSRRDLFFSYGTCQPDGNMFDFANYQQKVDLGGVDLVVSIPGLAFPTHFKRNENGEVIAGGSATLGTMYSDESVPFEGAIIDYLEALQPFVRKHNISGFTYTWTSGGARTLSPSAWTGAVHEVANKVVDMAASTFWVTTQRTLVVNPGRFSASVDYDYFYLWVRRPKVHTDLWTRAMSLVQPFGYDLWAIIIGITFATAVCNLWLGRHHSRKEHDDKKENAMFWFQCYLHHITKATADVLQAGFQDYPQTREQTMLHLGWAFFILIMITGYTANLAASLSRSNAGWYIRTMDEAISQNVINCVASAVENDVQRDYPQARWATIGYSETRGEGAMKRAFEDNNCSTIVWPMAYVDREPSDAKFMCDENMVAVEKVSVVEVAFPTSAQISGALSAAIKDYTQTKGRTYRDVEASYYPPRPIACTGVSWTDPLVTVTNREKLNAEHFAFPIFVWGVCAALSMGLSCLQKGIETGTRMKTGRAWITGNDGRRSSVTEALPGTELTVNERMNEKILHSVAMAVDEQAAAQKQIVLDLSTISAQMQKLGALPLSARPLAV